MRTWRRLKRGFRRAWRHVRREPLMAVAILTLAVAAYASSMRALDYSQRLHRTERALSDAELKHHAAGIDAETARARQRVAEVKQHRAEIRADGLRTERDDLRARLTDLMTTSERELVRVREEEVLASMKLRAAERGLKWLENRLEASVAAEASTASTLETTRERLRAAEADLELAQTRTEIATRQAEQLQARLDASEAAGDARARALTEAARDIRGQLAEAQAARDAHQAEAAELRAALEASAQQSDRLAAALEQARQRPTSLPTVDVAWAQAESTATAEAWEVVARIAVARGEFARAEQACATALERDASRADALWLRALARLGQANGAGARADVEACLQLDPGNASAQRLLESLQSE